MPVSVPESVCDRVNTLHSAVQISECVRVLVYVCMCAAVDKEDMRRQDVWYT